MADVITKIDSNTIQIVRNTTSTETIKYTYDDLIAQRDNLIAQRNDLNNKIADKNALILKANGLGVGV